MNESSNPSIRRAVSEGRLVKLEVVGRIDYTRDVQRFRMEQELID